MSADLETGDQLEEKLIGYRCPKCGEDCGHDANTYWDITAQAWALADSFDAGWCRDCGEVEPEQFELEGEELEQCRRDRLIAGFDMPVLTAHNEAFFELVTRAMQSSEEMGGPEGRQYIALMHRIAAEAMKRCATAAEHIDLDEEEG